MGKKDILKSMYQMLVAFLLMFLLNGISANASTFTFDEKEYDTVNESLSYADEGVVFHVFNLDNGDILIYIDGTYEGRYFKYIKTITDYMPSLGRAKITLYFDCKLQGEISTGIVTESEAPNVININFGSNFDSSKVTSMSKMFSCLNKLEELDLSSLNTANVTSMSSMFYGCSGLKSLDLSSFNTEKVDSLSLMFAGCKALKELDIDSFVTTNVTDMVNVFAQCYSLSELDLSSFNTHKVTDMKGMFSECTSLTSLDLSNFNTSNVENMSLMFMGCSHLNHVYLDNFITSNVTNMNNMFSFCNRLEDLDLSSFDTSNVIQMTNMFEKCSNLSFLDLKGFKSSDENMMKGMFKDCTKLKILRISDSSIRDDISINGCSSLRELIIEDTYFGDVITLPYEMLDSESGIIYSILPSGTYSLTLVCSHPEKLKSNKFLKSAATCEEAAVYYYECAICHKKLDETYIDEKPNGHKAASNPEITPASLNKDGLFITKCAVCNKVLSSKIINRAYVSIPKSVSYTAKEIKPLKVVDVNGKTIANDNYSITYKNNVKIGKAEVLVTFKNQYTGSKKYNFTIVPKATALSKVKAGTKEITVSWKKAKGDFTGYEIQYATSGNFKSGCKTVTVKSLKETSKKIRKLKSKKTYYVHIRVYKLVGGKKYYSDWSKTLKVKVK